jgi:hypothetical protein
MQRPVKINFKKFSLEETARELGIPKKRAQRILSLVGADKTVGPIDRRPEKRRSRHKAARKSSR